MIYPELRFYRSFFLYFYFKRQRWGLFRLKDHVFRDVAGVGGVVAGVGGEEMKKTCSTDCYRRIEEYRNLQHLRKKDKEDKPFGR
jgi:hypothetical protein